MREDQSTAVIRALQFVRQQLGIEYGQLGEIFGVESSTVDGWMIGIVPSPEHLTQLNEAGSLVQRLVRLFGSSRVADVVWRPAKLFGGERALEWILQGRLAEVVQRYEDSGLVPYNDIGL